MVTPEPSSELTPVPHEESTPSTFPSFESLRGALDDVPLDKILEAERHGFWDPENPQNE